MKCLVLTESEIAEAAEKIVAKYGFQGTLRGAILDVLRPTEVPEGAVELATEAVDTIDRSMLMLGEETETSYGPMQPPQVQQDKAIPYLAALIAAYSRQVPRDAITQGQPDPRDALTTAYKETVK